MVQIAEGNKLHFVDNGETETYSISADGNLTMSDNNDSYPFRYTLEDDVLIIFNREYERLNKPTYEQLIHNQKAEIAKRKANVERFKNELTKLEGIWENETDFDHLHWNEARYVVVTVEPSQWNIQFIEGSGRGKRIHITSEDLEMKIYDPNHLDDELEFKFFSEDLIELRNLIYKDRYHFLIGSQKMRFIRIIGMGCRKAKKDCNFLEMGYNVIN
ncbi:hypothetical protein ACI2OX_03700 [Bacillus sp. N9]